jgi:hypothetical protein
LNRTPLSPVALEVHDAFAERHIGPDTTDQQSMLEALGLASRAALMDTKRALLRIPICYADPPAPAASTDIAR